MALALTFGWRRGNGPDLHAIDRHRRSTGICACACLQAPLLPRVLQPCAGLLRRPLLCRTGRRGPGSTLTARGRLLLPSAI